MKQWQFKHVVAITAIASGIVALAMMVVGMAAVKFDFAAFEDPSAYVSIGSEAGRLVSLSMVMDMFGYYLLLLPTAIFLGDYLKPRNPQWMQLFTFSGLAYIIIGAAGAATLAATWPFLINLYEQGQQRETIDLIFKTVTTVVYGGLWNTLEMNLAGVWWLGIGLLLVREQRVLGSATIVLGIAAFLDAAGNILGMPALASSGLTFYLFFGPVWAIWIGILAARGFNVRWKLSFGGQVTAIPGV